MSEIKKKELWSIRARREVNDIIEKIKELPFIKGMMDGTLPLESTTIGQVSLSFLGTF